MAMFLLVSGASARTLLQDPAPQTLAEALAATEELSVLFEAVKAFPDLAGVVNNTDIAYTVFAPTNEAILGALAALGVGSLETFVKDYPVKDILTYHILPKVVKSTDLVHGTAAFTVYAGGRLIPDLLATGTPIVRGYGSAANVTKADIMAGKSVVHLIDNVLLPINPMEVPHANPAAAAVAANLTSLVAAVTKANLTAALSDPNLVATIFAPTNEAFEKALTALGMTLDTIPMDVLMSVLSYHVAPGYGPSWRMVADGTAKTLLPDQTLQWTYPDKTTGVPAIKAATNTANIVAANVFAGKAVIHVIDTVLLPTMG